MDERRKRRARKRRAGSYFDYTLLFIVVFLIVFGLVMLYSVSSYDASLRYDGDSLYYLKKQAAATLLGLFGMIVIILFDYHAFQRFALPAYFVSIALILMVLTSFGYEVNGARRWIRIGFSIQPAEFAKVGLIVFYATLICKVGKGIHDWKTIAVIIVTTIIPAGLILVITRNLSSTIIVCAIVFIMLFVATNNYKIYIMIMGGAAFIASVFILLVSKGVLTSEQSYRYARIEAWLNPEAYASDKAFQTLQSLYAIGSGGVFGKGLGQSMQKLGYIPEAQNDMIFSIICEELGLFGAIAIIILFFLMIWRFYVIANNAGDQFGTLLVVGVMAHIAIQVIFNIGVVTNIIPNTGITLPFISYGGSAVVFLLAEIGIVLNVSRHIPVKE